MLIVLVILNVVDAFSTLYLVSNGYAKELNPLMDLWLQMGPWHFLFVKLFLTSLGIGFLWFSREHTFVHKVTAALLVLYVIVVCVHIDIALSVIYFSTLQF